MTKTKEISLQLNYKGDSKESKALIESLYGQYAPKGVHKKPFISGLGAFIPDLLWAYAEGNDRYGYMRSAACDFTNRHVKARSFVKVFKALKAQDWVEHIPGHKPASFADPMKARASRYRATPSFIDLIAAHGITPENWRDHFIPHKRMASVPNPIILKSAAHSIELFNGMPKKISGKQMPVDYSDRKAIAAAKQVQEINAFISEQDIQPHHALPIGFHRIFAMGDVVSPYGWNKGGRLYAIGNSYQAWPSDPKEGIANYRGEITVNGEPTVEIDITASHLTILHAWKGMPLPAGDLYNIPGIPRSVVKAWVAYALGKGSIPGSRWSDTAKKKHCEKSGCKGHCIAGKGSTAKGKQPLPTCLQRDFQLSKVGPKIAKHFPILDDLEASPWEWGDFQFIESRAIIDAVHELVMVYGIAALPVHDSIIVPRSHQALAESVLISKFEKHVGITPRLKCD